MGDAQFCPVGKLEKLLLATDRSEFSEGAVREAIAFAAKCSSQLFVVTLRETNPEYESIGSNVFVKEKKEAQDYLESVKARAAKEKLTCETVLREGLDPAGVIVEEAAGKNVDMIVVGRRGRRGLLKALMGEVAAKVIAQAPCKVLVVPRAAQVACRNLLVATDGSTHGNAAVTEALAVAKRCGSNVLALSAARDDGELAEAKSIAGAVAELGRKEGVSVEALTPLGRSHDAIVETAGGRGIDLIIMGTYGKTGVKKLLMGSSTEKVIGRAGCAILVVKAD